MNPLLILALNEINQCTREAYGRLIVLQVGTVIPLVIIGIIVGYIRASLAHKPLYSHKILVG